MRRNAERIRTWAGRDFRRTRAWPDFFEKLRCGCRFGPGPFDHGVSARQICIPSTKMEPSCTQGKGQNMRVMVLVKACKESESGVMPIRQKMAEMGKFNDELVKAGIMLEIGRAHV